MNDSAFHTVVTQYLTSVPPKYLLEQLTDSEYDAYCAERASVHRSWLRAHIADDIPKIDSVIDRQIQANNELTQLWWKIKGITP